MNDHKKWVAEIFNKAAAQYGQSSSSSFFNYFGKRLVEHVPIQPGQKALDVATGRGAVLFPLAEAIGPKGRVDGIDISEQMLEETSQELKKRGIDWVSLHCMDAENLQFPDRSFDCVFCGFALFFLPSVSAAMAEFKRVLKKGGVLAVSIWGEDSLLDLCVNEEIKKISTVKSLAATSLFSAEKLEEILSQASFQEYQIFEENKEFVHATAEDWWESLWNHGTRAKFEQLTQDELILCRKNVMAKAESLNTDGGIRENLQVFYAVARSS